MSHITFTMPEWHNFCNAFGLDVDESLARLKNLKNLKNLKIESLKREESKPIMMELPSELKEEIEHWAAEERRNIIKEKTKCRDQPFAFDGVGAIGEEFALYMWPDSLGSASKGGMAFDNRVIDPDTKELKFAREIKFVCLEGTKICLKCKGKAPRYQPYCLRCGPCVCEDECECGKKFKQKTDSRAGISSKAHISYKSLLPEYIIFVMECTGDLINLKCFRFLTSNKYYNGYIQNQFDKNKGGCNFIPMSFDWHMSAPVKIMHIDIDISEESPVLTTHFYNLAATEIEKVPKNIFTKKEIKKYSLQEAGEHIDYSVCIEKNVERRPKHIGKSRGTVTRK